MNFSEINISVSEGLIPKAIRKESLYFSDSNISGGDDDEQKPPYIFDIVATSSYCIVSGSNNELRYYNYRQSSITLAEKCSFHSDIITKIKLHDDQLFFSSSKDGTVALWDLRLSHQRPAQMLQATKKEPLLSFDLNITGKVVAAGTELSSGGDVKILFWDLRSSNKVSAEFTESHSDDITQIQFHPTSPSKLLSGSVDGLICNFDLKSFDEDEELISVINSCSSINKAGYFGIKGENIYCLTHNETFSLWNFSEGELISNMGDIRTDPNQNVVEINYGIDCQFDLSTNRLYLLCGSNNGDISILNVNLNELQLCQKLNGGHDEIVRSVYWDPRTNIFISGGEDSKLCLWIALWDLRLSHQRPAQMLQATKKEPLLSFDLNITGKVVAAGTELSSGGDVKILFWDLRSSNKVSAEFTESHSDDITQIQFHPTSPSKLLSGSVDGLICNFDLKSFDEDEELISVINSCSSINKAGYFGIKGENIYCLTHNETFSLWNFSEGELISNMGDIRTDPNQNVVEINYGIDCQFDLSTNRLYLLCGSNNGDISILNVNLNELQLCQKLNGGHDEIVRSVYWDPRTNIFISGGEDSKLCLWNDKNMSESDRSKENVPRLKKHLDVITAFVKDVHDKLNKNPIDNKKDIEDSLQEIISNVDKFQNLQQLTKIYDFADEIDEHGVNFWNASITLKTANASSEKKIDNEIIAMVGFVMIQAGAISISELKNKIKLLTLASKVGKAWLDCGRSDKADEVLRSANLIEDSILSLQEKTAKDQNSKAAALVIYYAYRVEAAWKLSNTHIANLMLQNAIDMKYLNNVTENEIIVLCQVCFTIGHQASREGKINDAIKWLRQSTCYLKNSEYDESNLELAENSLNLCLEEFPGNVMATSIKLKLIKKKNLCSNIFEEAYFQLMKAAKITIDDLKLLLNDAYFVSEFDTMMALRGMDILIEERLSDLRNIRYIEKAIITKFHIIGNIYNFEKLEMEDDIIRSAEITLGFEQRHGIVLGHKVKTACQLPAKKWFTIAKLAICYLEEQAFADATEAVHKAQTHEKNSAANFYILYHISMEKSQFDQAIQYLHDMCKGDGFQGNMLAMVANNSYQKSNKDVLAEALKEILIKYQNGEDVANTDIFILLRCLIRMTLNSLSNTDAESSLKESICGYFEIALNILRPKEDFDSINSGNIKKRNQTEKNKLLKDLEWLYKTGLEFCQKSEIGSDLYAIRLFNVSHSFLCEYPEETSEIANGKRLCIFTSLCGQLFLSRNEKYISKKKELLEQTILNIDKYKKLKKVLEPLAQNDMVIITLFEFEAKVKLGQWDELMKILDSVEAYDFEVPSRIFERMAELLIIESECPSSVIFTTLQVLLDSFLKHEQIDIVQFSRWFRVLIITALAKKKQESLQYFQQALDIINQGNSKYPEEEIQWLMVSAWNCGIDYYSANDFSNAKNWCEMAIAFCKFLGNGLLYEEEMRKSYVEIIKNCDS
ncbi:20091_t:CDS:10 [Entrophospora sp. SA101]|nr:20091_t:CDS:10 [Entrophospora sp. SA101]